MKQSFPKDIHKTINRVMANHYFDLFNELIGTGKKNKAIQVALEAILNCGFPFVRLLSKIFVGKAKQLFAITR